jgi:excisionase family DNA binding protein
VPRSARLVGGGVSERPKEHASKACEGATPPWVQIPPPPPITQPPRNRVAFFAFSPMRAADAHSLVEAEADELLTTGEAAATLGTSRQHIVNLCNSGDLPFTTVGRHRRVSRQDVEALRTRTQRLTRDQLRSLWLSCAVAGHVVRDPERTLELARRNLDKMVKSSARGAARVWLAEWRELLDGPIEGVLEALTSRSPRSRELRQNGPFAGVLSERQRREVLAGYARAHNEDSVW